jgi:hypothetical protein
MKRIVAVFLIFCLALFGGISFAEETKLLTAEISMVPNTFYGTWRVVSKMTSSNSGIFKEKSLDVWNLSRTGDVITLYNLFNGAKAQITVSEADTRHVIFTKNAKQKDKELVDTVEININGDSFEGVDKIMIKTYVNGKIEKTESAKYHITGEKIGGGSIIE